MRSRKVGFASHLPQARPAVAVPPEQAERLINEFSFFAEYQVVRSAHGASVVPGDSSATQEC